MQYFLLLKYLTNIKFNNNNNNNNNNNKGNISSTRFNYETYL